MYQGRGHTGDAKIAVETDIEGPEGVAVVGKRGDGGVLLLLMFLRVQ